MSKSKPETLIEDWLEEVEKRVNYKTQIHLFLKTNTVLSGIKSLQETRIGWRHFDRRNCFCRPQNSWKFSAAGNEHLKSFLSLALDIKTVNRFLILMKTI